MDNATLMYIVIGLLFIFFVVLLVFSAKSWRILHLITAFLVFVAAAVLVFFTAATLRTQQEWRSVYNGLVKKVAQQEADHQKLLTGVLTDVKSNEVSLDQAEAALERVLIDRGRVWRGVTAEAAGDTITLTINAAPPPAEEAPAEGEAPAGEEPAAEPPAEGEGEPAPPARPTGAHGIKTDSIIYAFLEGESELTGDLKGAPPFMVPVLYLGEFRVTNTTDTTITVQPTSRLTALQQASLGEGNWTIYDNMPVDAQYVFDGLTEEDLRILFPENRMTLSDEQYDARLIQIAPLFEGKTEAEVAAIIPKNKLFTSADYDALINQYLNSGKEVASPDDYPAGTIFWKDVKILSPVSIQVDAVLRDVKGTTYTQAFEMSAAKGVKRKEGEVVIGEAALVTTKAGDVMLDTSKPGVEAPAGEAAPEAGQLRLALTISETLKQKSDYDIPELWDGDEERAVLKALTALGEKELDAVLEAKSVQLDIGDVMRVHPETAQILIQNKLAEEVQAIYVRPLRDYAHYFRDTHRQELLLEDNARVIKADTATLIAANAKALEQVTYRADEIMKLQADRAGFQRELAAITAVDTQAQARVAQVRAKLSELYKTNLQLAATIKSLQTQWAAAARPAATAPAPSTPAPAPAAVSAP